MNKGIDVEIIKDSINWTGHRLTTYVLKYPRYIHSELMTHRVFSKNSASSRAIPINRMIQNIEDDIVLPIWTLNQPGMQGKTADEYTKDKATLYWKDVFSRMKVEVADFVDLGIHKQNVNRLLEPWMHIRIILTGTDFENWFALRDHKDAQPEIQELARKMRKVMDESKPTYLKPGEWHIPFDNKYPEEELAVEAFKRSAGFGADREIEDAILDLRLKISVANCARISYNNVDGSKSTIEGDLEIYKKLVESEPLHASPSEHQACTPSSTDYLKGHMEIRHSVTYPVGEYEENIFDSQKIDQVIESNPELVKLMTFRGKYFSNLQGWIQLRKIIEEIKYKK